jgi:hypothetical protein
MTSHLGVMVLFAACVSAVFAVIAHEAPREQLRTGARIFGALVVGAYVLGWLMLLVFG